MPRVGEVTEAFASFRFVVQIDRVDHGAFTECTLPNMQIETEDLIEGGQNEYVHKLPIRAKPGPVTLRYGLMRGNYLLDWYMEVLQGNFQNALRTVTVTLHDPKLQPVSVWTFSRAYPIKWSGPTLKAGEQAVAIEVLEIAHHGFQVG